MVIVTACTQGTGWMHFSLSQLVFIYGALFTLPLTVLLWVGWAVFRRLRSPRAVAAYAAFAIALPFLYAFALIFARAHG